MADKRALEDTFNVVANLVDLSCIVQGSVSTISILCSILLYWIVIKKTPKEMHSRRAFLLMQLNGFTHHSVIILLFAPFALFPHRICLLSGPLGSIGSQWTPFIIAAWSANLMASANAVLSGSFVNYLALTEGIRVQKGFIELFRRLSFRTRIVTGLLFNATIAWIIFAAVYFSIEQDIATNSNDSFVDVLKDQYSAIAMGDSSMAVNVAVFSTVFVYFGVCSVYIQHIAKTDLEELKPTLSEKTFDMMTHMTRLLFYMALVPLFFLFIPGGLFIGLNVITPYYAENDGWLLIFTLAIEGLFMLYPISGHVLILLCFRQYRDALVDLLFCRPGRKLTASLSAIKRPSSTAVSPEAVASKRSRAISAGANKQLVKVLPIL